MNDKSKLYILTSENDVIEANVSSYNIYQGSYYISIEADFMICENILYLKNNLIKLSSEVMDDQNQKYTKFDTYLIISSNSVIALHECFLSEYCTNPERNTFEFSINSDYMIRGDDDELPYKLKSYVRNKTINEVLNIDNNGKRY